MKAIIPSGGTRWVTLDAVSIYRDDLEYVLDVISEAGLTRTLKDESFQYDSLDDLRRSKGPFVNGLVIGAVYQTEGFDAITVTLKDRSWRISSNEKFASVAQVIETRLRTRQSRLEPIPLLSLLFGSFTVAAAGVVIGSLGSEMVGTIVTAVGVACLVLLTGLISIWHFHSGIRLDFKHEASLWARYRSEIVSAVVGSIVTLAVQAIAEVL